MLGRLSQLLRPPRLTIELVPRPCWGKNVRALLTPEAWRSIQKIVFDRAGASCQICGWPAASVSYQPRFECHEVWRYDDWRRVQTLDGFIALCRFCHEVKHIGLARTEGRYGAAIAHLAKVNGWSRKAALEYAESSFNLMERRSRKAWAQDLNMLYDWLVQLDALQPIWRDSIR